MADSSVLLEGLLKQVRSRGGGVNAMVEAALRAVPRHVFVPDVPIEEAYRDEAIPTKRDGDGLPISSSSQPTIMAVMLDQLGLEPGHRVLEIGAGTGYNAALMAHIVGPDGAVVTMDIDEDVVARAAKALAQAGFPGARPICADGAGGHPDGAPYDRIIATVGVTDLAPAWLAQLAPGGRIVVPLDIRGIQRSVAFERQDGHWVSRSIRPCGFMRLRGALAGPEQTLVVDHDTGMWLMVPDDRAIDVAAVRTAFDGESAEQDVGVSASGGELFDGLGLWLSVQDTRSCMLSEPEDADVRRLPLRPLPIGDRAYARGMVDAGSIAVLVRRGDASWMWPSELVAVGYGPHGPRLAGELAGRVRAWAEAGRPSTRGLRVTAHPAGTPDDAMNGLIIDKPHTRLALSWPSRPAG